MAGAALRLLSCGAEVKQLDVWDWLALVHQLFCCGCCDGVCDVGQDVAFAVVERFAEGRPANDAIGLVSGFASGSSSEFHWEVV